MQFKYYKKGQGKIVRLSSGIALALLALFGCISLYTFVPQFNIEETPPPPTFWGTAITQIPFFELTINYGLIVSISFFLILILLIYLLIINKPSTADFLVETEIEMKKVSWPSKQEHTNSTIAVIISVLLIGIFLMVADSVFSQLMKFIRLN